MSFPIPVYDENDELPETCDPHEIPECVPWVITQPYLPVPEDIPLVVIAKPGWEKERN